MSPWWQQVIFYHIYPLGFFGCPQINPIAQIKPTLSQIQPVNRLAKIRQYYPHFQQLNIGAIYFGPVFESCTHGYDSINYTQIDRRLGTSQLLHEIIDELHQQKIKVIFDAVFNHTSRLFPAFIDLKNNQTRSPYQSWYKKINFRENTVWQDGFSYQYYQDCVELPEINLSNPEVQRFFLSIIQYWFSQFKIDGLRLDVAYLLPPDFLNKIKKLSTDLNPDSILIGETITPQQISLVDDQLIHTATNFPLYQHIHQSFTQNDFWQLKNIFRQQKNIPLFNFLNNHDTSRIFSQLEDQQHLQSAFVILLTHPGQPCLYYGDEFLLDGLKQSKHDQQVRSKMPNHQHLNTDQLNHSQFISKLIKIRQRNHFISKGQIRIIHCHHQSISYLIQNENKYLYIVINANYQHPLTISHDFLANQKFFDQLAPRYYQAKNRQLTLPPKNFFILKNQPI